MSKRMMLYLAVLMVALMPVTALSEGQIVRVDAVSWIVGKDPEAYVPRNMIDGVESTSFQFSLNTTPLGAQYLWFELDGPCDIDTLWIKNGFWKVTGGYDQYTRNSRVRTMTIEFEKGYGTGYGDPIQVTLPDDRARTDWTRVSLGARAGVTGVRLRIDSIYQGSKFPNDVCISEIRFTNGAQPSGGPLYGLAIKNLATRTGPGTQYTEAGTYFVQGEYIRVLARAWDSRNKIWWVRCEIPYRDEIRVLWTGYKRFDASTLPLSQIPLE